AAGRSTSTRPRPGTAAGRRRSWARPSGRAAGRWSARPGPRRGRVPGSRRGSRLQLGPDLLVAFRGPDDRALDPGQLVPQPGHVERQAVLEDRPVPVVVHERGVRGLERLLERAAAAVDRPDLADHHVQEVAGLLDRGVDLRPAAGHRAAPADELLGLERLDPVQRARGPLAVERVAGVERGLGLDEVTGEEDLVAGQPRGDVALGVAAAVVLQHEVAAVAAEVDGEPVGEREGRPGEPRYRVGALGEAGHAGELALPVLLA